MIKLDFFQVTRMIKHMQINVKHHSNKRNNDNKNQYDPINRHRESIWQHSTSIYKKSSQELSVSSVQFSHSIMSDSMWPHGLQHIRLPCRSPTPEACSNSSIESVMPSNHLNLCRPLLLLPSIFPSIRDFSNESILHIRWPKYWSFSFSIQWIFSFQWIFRTDFL